VDRIVEEHPSSVAVGMAQRDGEHPLAEEFLDLALATYF